MQPFLDPQSLNCNCHSCKAVIVGFGRQIYTKVVEINVKTNLTKC